MGNVQQEFQQDLNLVITFIRNMLHEKNERYGDSALNPKRIFSRTNSFELINVRIDDKLNRIMNRVQGEDEDVELDLIGYLLLKQVLKLRTMRK